MIEITASHDYERLDLFLVECLEISRTRAQKYIKDKDIQAEDKLKLKSSMPVHEGQKFFIEIPQSLNLQRLQGDRNVNFEVVYEDEYLFVINKPARLVVHPAPGNWHGTLVNGLVYRYPELRLINNFMRPGIVQRLDSVTSGLMTVARTQKMYEVMQKMFAERKVSKKYLAIVHGCPKKHEGILSGPLDRDPDNFMRMVVIEGGKPSLTGYKVLWSKNDYSLVMCELFTGRMHQIRAHMSALGCPLVGDTMYGAERFGDVFDGRVYLHSWQLGFDHPATGEAMTFRQTIPDDFREAIKDICKH